jgi:hypothetical protein
MVAGVTVPLGVNVSQEQPDPEATLKFRMVLDGLLATETVCIGAADPPIW